MTLTEVLIQLAEIKNKVTSTSFPTNITKIDSNINGDWKEWHIKFHTEKEPIDEDKLDKLSHDFVHNISVEYHLGEHIPNYDEKRDIFKKYYRKAKQE